MDKTQAVIVPCSGIDSVYGLAAQETALCLRKISNDPCDIMGLAYLVNGEVEAADAIEGKICIVINGCNRKCASNIVDFIGGEVAAEYTIADLAVGSDKETLGTPTELTDLGEEFVTNAATRILYEADVWGDKK